jgi:nicotinamide-nucleotide amidase
VTLHVEHEEASEDASLLETFRDQARMLLGDIVYSECRQTDLAQLIANRMASFENAPTVSVAESCTGGLVGKLLTDASGVSSWFIESAVCYANDAKVRRLGVSESTLQEHGAVSKATALAMARGIRQQAGTDIGLATTGIAGPSGGTPDKPVGTIHVALSHGTGEVHRLLNLSFGRSRNRTITAWVALDLLRRHLDLR